MDLDALGTWERVAALGGLLGLVGFVLPWFIIYGRPRSALDMMLATGDLSQHASPELLALWGLLLGLVLLAVLVATYLTVAPAFGRAGSDRVVVVASTFALGICLLLLVLDFQMDVGYWATTGGALLLVAGHVQAKR